MLHFSSTEHFLVRHIALSCELDFLAVQSKAGCSCVRCILCSVSIEHVVERFGFELCSLFVISGIVLGGIVLSKGTSARCVMAFN
jgi:hypothetical protein